MDEEENFLVQQNLQSCENFISQTIHPWSSINYLIELPKIVSSKTLDILEILNLEA